MTRLAQCKLQRSQSMAQAGSVIRSLEYGNYPSQGCSLYVLVMLEILQCKRLS